MGKLFNFLDAEVKTIFCTENISDSRVEVRNKGIENKVLQERDTDVCTSLGVQYTNHFIKVFYHLLFSLWASVWAQCIQSSLIDSVIEGTILKSHVERVHN